MSRTIPQVNKRLLVSFFGFWEVQQEKNNDNENEYDSNHNLDHSVVSTGDSAPGEYGMWLYCGEGLHSIC